MEKNMKKRALTLIEIMIVIFLITLITGAIGYNMKGSMDKGKEFRTKQAHAQLHDLLLICLEEGTDPNKLAENPTYYIRELGLAKNPDKILQDGWNNSFEIKLTASKKDFEITTKNLPNLK
jgi:Tfp pilus assembly protein PilE